MHKVLNALMASHCFSYPFSWFQGHPVEPAKSLHGKGEEGDPLVPGLSSPLHLALKCLLRGTPRLSISTFDWTRVRRGGPETVTSRALSLQLTQRRIRM